MLQTQNFASLSYFVSLHWHSLPYPKYVLTAKVIHCKQNCVYIIMWILFKTWLLFLAPSSLTSTRRDFIQKLYGRNSIKMNSTLLLKANYKLQNTAVSIPNILYTLATFRSALVKIVLMAGRVTSRSTHSGFFVPTSVSLLSIHQWVYNVSLFLVCL